ncbi:HAD family hydrolase [Agromyces protaetiae]|uniref:HAD family hydrolase n=1 Tax=Agromyces protaetiae TaxID=2509455 RepID=A0A4P6FEM2_9MICO|nr:HAD family hydrolase [Agromyces protaetiae]QAY74632.1 HAD family hydrolase [Agromyces protaetiae]
MSGSAVVLFDLDDTLMAHREAVVTGIGRHMRDLAYEGDEAHAATLWHDLEEEHYHAYLAGDLTFEGQRRARARAFAAAHGDALDDESAGRWFESYFERYRESWSLHADALPAFAALEQALHGVRFGVITNGELDFQTAKLARLGLERRFDHVVASGAFGATKPDPSIFRHAVDLFAADAPVALAVYVGDRLRTDAIGAARAGLTGVWLNRHAIEPAADERAEAEASGVLEIATLAELAPLLAALA